MTIAEFEPDGEPLSVAQHDAVLILYRVLVAQQYYSELGSPSYRVGTISGRWIDYIISLALKPISKPNQNILMTLYVS